MGLRNETGTHRGHRMRKRIEPVGIPRIHAGEDVNLNAEEPAILRALPQIGGLHETQNDSGSDGYGVDARWRRRRDGEA
jgi:hypothetical protein